MTTTSAEGLPELPEPVKFAGMTTVYYTADQMRAYGEQCRAASNLTADMAKALPGGIIDDTTFDQIEHALDRAGAPATDDNGKWLTIAQRVDALSRGVPEGEYPEAAEVCAEAYQVVGCMLMQLGLFDTPEAEKILDNLSQHRMVHRDVLPWTIGPEVPLGDK